MKNKSGINLALKIITMTLLGLTLFILLIAYSLNFSAASGGDSVWFSAGKLSKGSAPAIISCFLIIGFIFDAILLFFSMFQTFSKKIIIKRVVIFHIYYNLGLLCLYFILSLVLSLYSFSMWVLILILIIFNGISLLTYKLSDLRGIEKSDSRTMTMKTNDVFVLIIQSLIMLFIFICAFIPLLSREQGFSYSVYKIIKDSNLYNIDMQIVAIALFLFCIANFLVYLLMLIDWIGGNGRYLKKSNFLSKMNLAIAAVFFVISFIYCFAFIVQKVNVNTVSYIPFVVVTLLTMILAYFHGKLKMESLDKKNGKKKNKYRLSIIPLIFVLLFTGALIGSIFVNYIKIDITVIDSFSENYNLKGLDLLKDFGQLNLLFQAFAFLYFTFIFTSIMLLAICIFAYFGKSRDYYKIIKGSILANFAFMFLLSVSAIFFYFNQILINNYAKLLLTYLGVVIDPLYTYSIKSDVIYLFIVALVLLLIMFATRQLNHEIKEDAPILDLEMASENTSPNMLDKNIETSDPCPAFSELDERIVTFEIELRNRRKRVFEVPTLPKIVGYIVNYAQTSRLHLTYSYEDMATFVAGLGSAKLAILQGLSGTGKTSLPKIFTEAISGNCDIIEVESSWRDKNELIGYYNEFSKRFTPRKFTQALYKAKLNPEVLTFIVLDEMNLSRIEYYFSDFLSLMESEPDKRALKLLNIKINPPERESYRALIDGHTIKIPSNVWFIGTANHDESTFEISDKVYDRAQTMMFNHRAHKVRTTQEALPVKFVSYETLNQLFAEAKSRMSYDAESDPIIQEVEHLLAPYNISFGNRALNQIEDFVKVYCACFANNHSPDILKQAVENILFTKMVRKLSTRQVDDKEELAISFDKLSLHRCSAFIRQLNED